MKFSSQAYFSSVLTTKFHLPSKRIQNGFFLFSEKYFLTIHITHINTKALQNKQCWHNYIVICHIYWKSFNNTYPLIKNKNNIYPSFCCFLIRKCNRAIVINNVTAIYISFSYLKRIEFIPSSEN